MDPLHFVMFTLEENKAQMLRASHRHLSFISSCVMFCIKHSTGLVLSCGMCVTENYHCHRSVEKLRLTNTCHSNRVVLDS